MNVPGDSGLGENLRRRRSARGWSLRTLSERSGVSAAMLSDIERDRKSPTVRLAYQIARALDCSITDLVTDDDGGTQRLAAEGVERTSHPSPLLHGGLEVAVYRLEPGATTGSMECNRPGTLETLVALDGAVELVLDGHATRLEEGDSTSHGVHRTEYRNTSDTDACRFLVLIDSSRSA